MNDPAERNASYQDLLALPENMVGEILNGRLHSHPRPAPKHAQAYSALGYNVGGPFGGGPGGWWILDEPELHLGPDVIVPDLAGWRREHMPEAAWFELAPDWACEILSPSTARTGRAVKMPLYAHERVPYLWLVDPDTRTLEVYRLQDDGHWLLLETLTEDEPVAQPPFEAVAFSLASLWG